MKKYVFVIVGLMGLTVPALAFEEGRKVICDSEFVVGREAHLDQFFLVPRVQEDRLRIQLLSQDLQCGRRQDASGRLVYQWFSIANKQRPYAVDSFYFTSANTTEKPLHLGNVRLSWRSEIQFETAPESVRRAFPQGSFFAGNLELVTLNPKLSDLLGSSLTRDLFSGRLQQVSVQLVIRRDMYSGGERFILKLQREASTGRLYARLIKN